jgi:alanyl-tRNA synthetase
MENVRKIITECVGENFIQAILSNAKHPDKAIKVKLRPVRLKDELYIQEIVYVGTKVFHSNLTMEEAVERICTYMEEDFKQGLIQTRDAECTILISKKGKATVKVKRKETVAKADLSHNRQKQYILEEGSKIPFLMDLGIMTAEGKVALLAAGTDAAVSAGFKAGDVIRNVAAHVGGRGGGKPTMAQAGGSDASGIDAALAAARELLGA